MNRRNILLAVAGTGISGYGASAFAKTQWKLGSGYKLESFHGRNLSAFARDVKASTGDELDIALHPDNSLVPMSGILKAVAEGRLQAGEAIMTALVKDIPTAGVDSVPFIVRSYDDAARLWKAQRPVIEKRFQERGLTVLYAVPWPPQCLYTNKAVATGEDLKGTRMRTYNSTTVRIAELMGATPVDVVASDVGKAAAEGRIDNMITSATTGVDNKVWDVFKYYYEINAWYPKNILFVNSAALRALPPAHREAVIETGSRIEKKGWEQSPLVARDTTNELRAHGMKVEPLPSLLIPQIRRFGEIFSKEWIRAVGNEANEIFIPYYTKQ